MAFLNLPDHRPPDVREAERKNGICYVDAFLEAPNFVEQYVMAAQKIAERMRQEPVYVDVIGLPLLYVIRHATELIVKALLVDALEVADKRRELGMEPIFSPTADERHAVDSKHDLLFLQNVLTRALEDLGFAATCPSLRDLVNSVVSAEDGNETAFRYPYRRKNGKKLTTFNAPTRLPVLELEELLGKAFYDHMIEPGGEYDDPRLQCQLWQESMRLMEIEEHRCERGSEPQS